jgi:hypothetical protein
MAIVRAVVLSVLVAVPGVACQPQGRTFQTTLQSENTNPLPVTLTDETELVTGIAQADVDPAALADPLPVVHALASDPNASILTWEGGACDQDTTVRFHVLHGGYVLNVAVHEKSGIGCPAAAVPRAIRLTTSRPIAPDSIVLDRG